MNKRWLVVVTTVVMVALLTLSGCDTLFGSGDVAAAPTITPDGGMVKVGVNAVQITTEQEGTIYYTLDGTDPDAKAPAAEATEYTEPFFITELGAVTIKAIVWKESIVKESILSKTRPVATATFSAVENLGVLDATVVTTSSTMGVDDDGEINNGDFAWAGWGTGALNNGSALLADDDRYGTFDVWGNARPINAFSTTTESSNPDDEQWIQYDFGEAKSFSQVELYPRNNDQEGVNFPQDYTIQYSSDGESWSDALAVTAPETPYVPDPASDPVVHSFDEVTARYFRLKITEMIDNETPGSFRAQLMELEVWGY
jgi:hypothetical protein